VGSHTDNCSRRLYTDIHRLDIRNNRILYDETSAISTVRSTTKRELSTTATSTTTYNANNQHNDQKRRDLMTEETTAEKDSDWKKFIRKHWGIVAVFVLAVALAAAGAVYVFWWFAGNAQSTGLVPSTLNLWTM
jgi:hypothetical protein